MNTLLNTICICLIMFCASKARAMSYMTLMNEQDLPITGSPERFNQIYIANIYDDNAHIHPLRCKKNCKQCATQQAETTKVFARKGLKQKK